MKPARSILPAVDQGSEQANGPRVAMVGLTASLVPLLRQAVTPRPEPQPDVLAWVARAPIDPYRTADRRLPTINPAGPAATPLASATPRRQRPH
jgi:hypothetical protein